MKTWILISMLGAASTTAYFAGRIYLLLAENKAQAVEAQQRMHDMLTNKGKSPALVPWVDRGLR